MVDSESIFRFQFSPINMISKYKNGGVYKVYTCDKDKMNRFLSQHNFDMTCVHIDCLSVNDVSMKDIDDSLLEDFVFKSNSTRETYIITTTRWLVSNAIDITCAELSEYLLFGPPAVRSDIEIFKIINDLINTLPYAYVLDHACIDGDYGNYSNSENQYYNLYENDMHFYGLYDKLAIEEDPSFTDNIYESMYNDSFDGEIQPITIESYVNGFTSLLVDKFD